MKLYVMRHGPAEESSRTGRDGDRALTIDGRDRTRAVARALAAENEAPLTIVSSPLVRALQTAEIVAAVTDLEGRVRQAKDVGRAPGTVEVRREMAPGGHSLGLVLELARSGRKRAMIVGHEPDLSMLVARLVGQHLPQGMLKSMVVGIKVDPPPHDASKDTRAAGESDSGMRTELRFVLDPKTLAWHRG